MLHNEGYRNHWEVKNAWYQKHGFADNLIVTQEAVGFDSQGVLKVIHDRLGV